MGLSSEVRSHDIGFVSAQLIRFVVAMCLNTSVRTIDVYRCYFSNIGVGASRPFCFFFRMSTFKIQASVLLQITVSVWSFAAKEPLLTET